MTASKIGTLAPLSLVLALAAACPDGSTPDGDVTCGPDTKLVDGACKSTVEPVECAEGTVLDAETNECRAVASCGEGTTRDPETGACRPVAVCGPGTTLNPGTGLCEPDVVCGPDTVFDPTTGRCTATRDCGPGTVRDEVSGTCVPEDRCGDGTIFQPLTGLCLPELVCGPGLVADEGVCRSVAEVIAAGADVVEPFVESNDPAYEGGAPAEVTLEEAGSALVISGIIARPIDLDGDDAVDQDVDVWRFTATAGQTLRIRVVSNGLPNPAFRLTGPDGYVRTSRLGLESEPSRLVVLPRDGAYDLAIAPRAFIAGTSSVPFGGPELGYVVLIEEVPFPTPTVLDARPFPDAATAEGDVLDLEDNVFSLQTDDGGALGLSFLRGGTNNPVVLMLFDANGAFLDEVAFSQTSTNTPDVMRMPMVAPGGAVLVLVDWTTSTGLDDPFTLSASRARTLDLGSLGLGDDTVIAEPQVLQPGEPAAFVLDAPQGAVLTADFEDLTSFTPTLVAAADGTPLVRQTSSTSLDGARVYLQQGGRVTVVTMNGHNLEDVARFFARVDEAPVISLTGGETSPIVVDGPDLEFTRRLPPQGFVLLDVETPMLLQIEYRFRFGTGLMRVQTLDENGRPSGSRSISAADVPFMENQMPAGLALLHVELVDNATNPEPPIVDWELALLPRPSPEVLEVEPNDAEAPQPLDLPARVSGHIADDLFDFYTFELDPPLGPDEVLEIRATSLNLPTALPLRAWDAATFDPMDLDANELFDVTGAPVVAARLSADDGPGPFILEVEGTSDDGQDYVLEVVRLAVPYESEPNDDVATANTLSAFPAHVQGLAEAGGTDRFRLELPDADPAGVGVFVRAKNLFMTTDLNLTVDNGTVTMTSRHEDAGVFTRVYPGQPLEISVAPQGTTSQHYELTVEPQHNVEEEPNQTVAAATPFALEDGRVELYGSGLKGTTLHDHFVITPDRALQPGEQYSIRWTNLTDGGSSAKVIGAVLDAAGTVVVEHVNMAAGEIVYAPWGSSDPFILRMRPDGNANRTDLYRVIVERLELLPDVEPNDALDTAQAVTLPAVIRAQTRSQGTSSSTNQPADPDFYTFTLDQPLGPGESLSILASTRVRVKNLTLRLYDETGTEVATDTASDAYIEAAPAGTTFTVEVLGSTTTNKDYDVYDLDVVVLGP